MEQIVADPVPQILDGVQHVPRERVQCASATDPGGNRGACCW